MMAMSLKGLPQKFQNPIDQIPTRCKTLRKWFQALALQQSIVVEAAVVTTTSAAQGAAIGAFMGTLTGDAPAAFAPPSNAALNPQAMASLKQAQALAGGPLIQAQNFAIMTGVNAGITCVLKRLRGRKKINWICDGEAKREENSDLCERERERDDSSKRERERKVDLCNGERGGRKEIDL